MKLRAFAIALVLAGCAAAGEKPVSAVGSGAAIAIGEPDPNARPVAPSGVSKYDRKIDFGDWRGPQDPDALSGAFAAQVDARYGPEPGFKAVKSDLEANGFTCRDVAPVEARADYLMSACEKQEMHQSCGNIWSVSLRYSHGSGSADATRVTPRGGFERLCLGANPKQ